MKHRMLSRRAPKNDPAQATISHVFAITKAAKTPSVEHPELKSDLCVSKKLTSSDIRIQAFYDSLNPREVIAHSIAVEKLGTSYDVSRTHGFLRWSKANPK
jgi:hypothetical protein